MRRAATSNPWSGVFFTIFVLLTFGGCDNPKVPTGATKDYDPPPPTRVEEVVDVLHGVEIVDPYRWLEDQESPETRAWIEAQNAYTVAHLGSSPKRTEVMGRLEELLRVDRVGTPIEVAGRFFVWKKKAEDDLWVLHLRSALDGEDEVLLDPHTLSEDHTTSLSILDIDPSGRFLAYGVREGGADEVEVRIFDVDARQDLPDRLPTALYRSVALTADGQGFYYGRRDRQSGVRIYHHRFGDDTSEDREIFGEGYGPGQWIFVSLSADGRYLLISVSHGWSHGELFLQDLQAGGPLVPLFEGVKAQLYPAFAGHHLVVQTDWQAPKGRILALDLSQPDWEDWQEIVSEGEATLQGFGAVAGQIFVHTLHDVVSKIERYSLGGERLGEVPLPGLGSASTPAGSWDGQGAFFTYESFTTPSTLFRFEADSEEVTVWHRSEVPFDGDAFVTEQHWYASKDGTRVPMFVVSQGEPVRDGQTPTLLYGYGGFNVSQRPRFRILPALWVELGGVYALANLRGGGEFGEEWHQAGMLENKQNVFDDFIAAAEWLMARDITSPRHLAIQGGSNGGLLVGASMTQRPELFRAVLCQFPDLDMVRYFQFENNNPPALLEYGDASDPQQFEYLVRYSPYQNVEDGTPYPAVLLTSGDRDTRVPPLQARKMTARLQAATSSGHPVFLHYDTKAGHAGGRPLSKQVEDLSLELAFLREQVGL